MNRRQAIFRVAQQKFRNMQPEFAGMRPLVKLLKRTSGSKNMLKHINFEGVQKCCSPLLVIP